MKSVRIHLTPWQEGVSWQTKILSVTLNHAYYEVEGLSFNKILKSEQGKDWAKNAPEKTINALVKFEHKYNELALSCAWFVSRNRYAEELLLSSPFLTWFILRIAVRHKLEEDDVFALFGMKRKHLLVLEDFPPEPQLLKFFERLDQQGIAVKEYSRLKEIILENGYKDLAEFKTINAQMLRLLISSPEVLKYRFMQNLPSFSQVKNILMLAGETRLIGHYYEPEIYEEKLLRCKNEQALKALHRDYLKKDLELLDSLKTNDLFPFPPIKGNENIKYIRFRKELLREGNEMQHCVGGYLNDIMKEQYFVYKVLSPQRATLGLHFMDGVLTIDQVKLRGNAKVSVGTLESIKAWLKNK